METDIRTCMEEVKEQEPIRSPLAPIIPPGKTLGKETMIFALSNDILKALPLDAISSGAQSLYEYLSTHAADEISKAVTTGTYDYTNTKVKRFSFNIKEYIDFCGTVGKKHYTYAELSACADELIMIPIKFLDNDGKVRISTVIFSSIVIDSETGQCTFEMPSDFLSHWAPELSVKGEQHLLSLTESFKLKGYQNSLYKMINGHMQTMSSEYSVPINNLKTLLGVKAGTRNWDNGRFCERVLAGTCKEINEKSDIKFSYRVERHEKSRRIKNIVFYDFFRKDRVINSNEANIIDGEYKECENTKTSNISSVVIELSEAEKILARIIVMTKERGFSFEEAYELYDIYKDDMERFMKRVEMYDAMIKSELLESNNKMKFFKNMDI